MTRFGIDRQIVAAESGKNERGFFRVGRRRWESMQRMTFFAQEQHPIRMEGNLRRFLAAGSFGFTDDPALLIHHDHVPLTTVIFPGNHRPFVARRVRCNAADAMRQGLALLHGQGFQIKQIRRGNAAETRQGRPTPFHPGQIEALGRAVDGVHVFRQEAALPLAIISFIDEEGLAEHQVHQKAGSQRRDDSG